MTRVYRLYRYRGYNCSDELCWRYQLEYSYFKLLWTDIGPSFLQEEEADSYFNKYIKAPEWVKYYT